MTLRLFNTLTGQLDPLAPADGKALRMYACGPTVYDYGHIGNFRTFLQIDILRRFLRLSGEDPAHYAAATDLRLVLDPNRLVPYVAEIRRHWNLTLEGKGEPLIGVEKSVATYTYH